MSTKKSPRLLSRPEVLDRVGLGYPYIWKLMQQGDFPRSRAIGGGGGKGKVAWIESEIDEWVTNLPVKKLKGEAA